jgi:hypothetical protein
VPVSLKQLGGRKAQACTGLGVRQSLGNRRPRLTTWESQAGPCCSMCIWEVSNFSFYYDGQSRSESDWWPWQFAMTFWCRGMHSPRVHYGPESAVCDVRIWHEARYSAAAPSSLVWSTT